MYDVAIIDSPVVYVNADEVAVAPIPVTKPLIVFEDSTVRLLP